jgi:hypothetical protein
MENYREILEERFIYIGITEDIQTSVDRLADKLGRAQSSIPVKNISEYSEEIPQGARDKFMEENPLEYAIYNYAREKYN